MTENQELLIKMLLLKYGYSKISINDFFTARTMLFPDYKTDLMVGVLCCNNLIKTVTSDDGNKITHIKVIKYA